MLVKQMNNQKGFALILTMVMLAVLSTLGVMVLNSTDTELAITGNYRMNTDAFIGTELGVEYAKWKVVNEREDIDEGTDYLLTETNPDDEDAGQIVDETGAAIAGLLPNGIELNINGRNEIDFYTGMVPESMQRMTSTDAYQRNIFRTSSSTDVTTEGEVAYYRVSVEAVARGRSTARVETVFVNRGGQVF